MSSTDAPGWWADVQQEREDLVEPGRRPADDWLGEEIDFVPRRRITRRATTATTALAGAAAAARRDDDIGAAHPLHGVFLGADAPRAERPTAPADDPFATPPPPPGTRRTVQITGRPEIVRAPSTAQRLRGRTAVDRVGHRPDRIALWAVLLGAILIVLAAMSSSSQAAVRPAAATPHVATVTVPYAAPPASLLAPR
jgi:hypothetical protein